MQTSMITIENSREVAERVGPAFTQDGMLAARQLTRLAIEEIAKAVKPGMIEEDAVDLARAVLRRMDLHATWHPVRVRFGRNTTRAMKQASEPGVVLQENDIFFIDIAPRHGAWEGDGGETFTVGNDALLARCARDAQELFHEVGRQWAAHGWTGARLYEFAQRCARDLGWELNLDLPGHRLSDFPHAAIHTGALAATDFRPSALRWVLEIHLLDPLGRFGAFFEDLLLDDRFAGASGR
jgi:methionyl aminopeptidase